MKAIELTVQRVKTGKRFFQDMVQCPEKNILINADKCLKCRYLRIYEGSTVKCTFGNPIHNLEIIPAI